MSENQAAAVAESNVEATVAATPVAVESSGGAQAVAEAKPVVVGKAKSKADKGTGDLIVDTAVQVENLNKAKALARAETLFETIETSFLELGGVLKVIKDNTWFEGYESFDAFVLEKFGFAGRKADYLIQIYSDLTTKQIPWAKVSHLGWTKLKDLSKILTAENVDDWVAKAEKLTVLELQAALKAKPEAEAATKTTDEFVKLALKVKADQKVTIDTAIAKAKGELGTEYDAVALENICASFLAGGGVVKATVDTSSIETLVKTVEFMPLMEVIAEAFPAWNISVEPVKTEAAA